MILFMWIVIVFSHQNSSSTWRINDVLLNCTALFSFNNNFVTETVRSWETTVRFWRSIITVKVLQTRQKLVIKTIGNSSLKCSIILSNAETTERNVVLQNELFKNKNQNIQGYINNWDPVKHMCAKHDSVNWTGFFKVWLVIFPRSLYRQYI